MGWERWARAARGVFCDSDRFALYRLAAVLGIGLATLLPWGASAQRRFHVGDRIECDGTNGAGSYLPGVVIAPRPGETYNGHSAESGWFYRVRIDGRDEDGILCQAEFTRTPRAPASGAGAGAPAVAPRPSAAAQGSATPGGRYAIGQRVECDSSGLKEYYEPGVVIAPKPGETFNGYSADSGYFYRVRIDRHDPAGVLCKAEDMRPASAAAQAASRPVRARPGSRFGTREPRTCPPMRTPPASPAQVVALAQCEREGATATYITLMENVSVQIGAPRRYQYSSDFGYAEIDPAVPVLPIRGSIDSYQCAKVVVPQPGDTYGIDNTGRNCLVSPEHRASGLCYRTSFGTWRCRMSENVDTSLYRRDQPPPAR